MAGVYSIGSAARLLRVPPATIRTWEKRYGIVVPQRTDGGQRLYSHDQLEQLRFVVERIGAGMRPGEAHRLLREAATSLELELPGDTHAPAAARRAVEPLAQGLPDDVRFQLRLLVSELVANSVRHAGLNGGATVRIRARLEPDRVHVEVHDRGRFDWRDPEPHVADAEGGRGLPLVAALSIRWGLTFDGGTTAWFELPRAET
ncbi:MAG TPA: MerR family transcriptional regulator [Gaiellaceae bacterium]|nr:MerR family transcriptional regulator [Gaiellaceae bacterium]